MEQVNQADVVTVQVDCIIENNRLKQVYSNGETQNEFCVHGLAYRWHCELCEEYFESKRDIYGK